MMEEKEEGGISIGDIFRIIFSQKWLALIITILVTIVGTVGIYFYGQKDVNYSVSFVLQLPKTGDASATTYTYPDGDSFYFTDLISLENLKTVASREGFGSIDVENMVKSNDISIMRTVDKLDENSTDGVYDLNYTIKVKAKYFEDVDSARGFIEALALIPREHIAKMDINYDKSLTTSKSAITYNEQLSLLRSQTVYIQSKYNELVAAYGSEFIVQDGRTLAQCKDEIDAYLTTDLFNSLISKAEERHYIKSGEEEKLKYESELYSKDQQLKDATATLNGLQGIQTPGAIILDEIISLNREIAILTREIDILKEFIKSYDDESKIAPAEFEAEIAKVEASVSNFTDGIKPVASYVYGKVTKINYLSSNVVGVEGGTSLVKSVLISLVAGIVLAAIIAYIAGYCRLKKAKPVKEAVIVYPEAQLQIAATNAEEEKEEKEDK